MKIRDPVVAGMFYESSPEALRGRIEWCFKHELGPGKLVTVNPSFSGKLMGLVSPHAGYIYSGPIAAWSYAELAAYGKPDSFIILGPNHSGFGAPIAMMREGGWRTPLGVAEVDSDLADLILKASDVVEVDSVAHLSEHSIEVQLPFLQYLYGDIKFVPISMMIQNYEVSNALGRSLASVVDGKQIVIIASTDFSHYVPRDAAYSNDLAAIDKILNLDAKGLFDLYYLRNLSMCGPGPVASMLVASKLLGASSAKKLRYATSGDVTGDFSAVVGYSSIAVYR